MNEIIKNEIKRDPRPSNISSTPVDTFFRNKEDYDFMAPYQRGESWKIKFRQDLIHSMRDNILINSVMLVRKGKDEGTDDYNKFWVLDGRQRLETIIKFKNNEFSIELLVKINGKDCIKKCTYDRINSDKNKYPEYKTFISRFDGYQIPTQIFDNLDFEDQKKLFNRVNQCSPLKTNEKIFCSTNVLSRKLFKYVFNSKIYPKLKDYLKSEVSSRDRDTRFAHDLAYLCFGHDLKGDFAIRCLDAKTIKKNSLSSLEEFLSMILKWDSNTIVDDDILKDEKCEKISKNIKLIEEASELLKLICECRDNISSNDKSKFTTTTIFDFLSFYIKNNKEKILTPNMIKSNKMNIYKLLQVYTIHKSVTGLDNRSTQKASIEGRFNLLERAFKNPKEYWNSVYEDTNNNVTLQEDSKKIKLESLNINKLNFNIDFDVKKDFTAEQKRDSIVASDGRDPIDNSDLLPENINIDHSNSKSNSSINIPIAMTRTNNIKAGGNDIEFSEKVLSIKKEAMLK